MAPHFNAASGMGNSAREARGSPVSQMPRYWLLMFRPETYELVKKHGVIGVVKGHAVRFAEVLPGDHFVVYVSRLGQFQAHGLVQSSSYTDTTPIFGPASERYCLRARVTFSETGFQRDGRQLLYGLSVFGKALTTAPTNLLFCSGGFMEITSEDFDWLLGCMTGRIQPKWEGTEA